MSVLYCSVWNSDMLDITLPFFWLKTILSDAVLSDLAKCPGASCTNVSQT